MPGRIPSQFIDDLLTRIDIVEVIDSRVALKKAGREFQACCPFHNEKTPSFTVSPAKQFYHCFGCGAHGSAISFLMEFERMEFVDAIEELASMAGIEVPRESSGLPQKQHRSHYEILQQASDFYKQQLKQHANAAQAVEYLKQRGLSGDTAARFDIGYAPPGWDNILNFFSSKGVGKKQLLDVGLIIDKPNGGHYDRFRNRIMFPIRDRRGRVIAFGGRALGDDTPKYLNSPETDVFHKGRELYGLFEARSTVRNLQQIVVVEGYMDVVSLAQYRVDNAVATLGTATTPEHLEKLFRIVSDVVFCFDGDRAGRQAAWRALETSLPHMHEGRQVHFMFLPEGEDPDTIVQKQGKPGFEAALQQSLTFSAFFFNALSKGVDMGSIDGRSLLVDRSKPYLSKLPDGVFRHMMMSKLAEIVHVESEKLATLIFSSGTSAKHQLKSVKMTGGPSPVRQIIRLLLEQPALAEGVDTSDINGLQLPGIPLLIELIDLIQSRPQVTCGAILEHWRDSENAKHLKKLARLPLEAINNSDDGIKNEFMDILQWLRKQRQAQRLEELLDKSHLGSLSPEEIDELKEALAAKI